MVSVCSSYRNGTTGSNFLWEEGAWGRRRGYLQKAVPLSSASDGSPHSLAFSLPPRGFDPLDSTDAHWLHSEIIIIARGSHLRTACGSVCDRDQNRIKRSKGYFRQIKRS